MTAPAAGSGLFDSLRRLIDTAIGLVQVRLELFGTELEQEKLRLFDAVLMAALGLLLSLVTVLLAVAFVVLLLQEPYRLPAIALLALGCGGGAWLLVRSARESLRHRDGGAFPLTLAELRRDRAEREAPIGPHSE